MWWLPIEDNHMYTSHVNINIQVRACVLCGSVMSNWLFATSWTPTGLLCLWGFSRQEYWCRLPFSSAGDLPNRGIEPMCLVSLHWQAGSSTLELPAAAAAKSLQSCLTLCDPIDGSPPGSPVPGIIQARTLEWVAISFSNAWKWKNKVKSLSHVRFLVTRGPTRPLHSWDFPGKSTGVGCHRLLLGSPNIRVVTNVWKKLHVKWWKAGKQSSELNRARWEVS